MENSGSETSLFYRSLYHCVDLIAASESRIHPKISGPQEFLVEFSLAGLFFQVS